METLNIQCIEQQQVLITLTLTDSNGAPVDLTRYAVYAASVGAVDPYCRRAARLEWAAAINNECSAFIITAPGHDIARAPWKYTIYIKNRQLGLEWAVVTGRIELTPRACGTDGISPAAYSVACEATPSGLVNVTLDATVGSISETLEQVKASAALASSSAANAHADLEDARKAATTAAQAATTAAADAKTAAEAATRAEQAATDAPQACAPFVGQVQAAAVQAQQAATHAEEDANRASTAATTATEKAQVATDAATAAASSATDLAAARDTAVQASTTAQAAQQTAQLASTTATTAAENAREYAEDAQQAQQAAATSETNAAASAQQASDSASAAAASAATAQASAATAVSAKSDLETARDTAVSAATSATDAATAAASSESNATAAATAATAAQAAAEAAQTQADTDARACAIYDQRVAANKAASDEAVATAQASAAAAESSATAASESAQSLMDEELYRMVDLAAASYALLKSNPDINYFSERLHNSEIFRICLLSNYETSVSAQIYVTNRETFLTSHWKTIYFRVIYAPETQFLRRAYGDGLVAIAKKPVYIRIPAVKTYENGSIIKDVIFSNDSLFEFIENLSNLPPTVSGGSIVWNESKITMPNLKIASDMCRGWVIDHLPEGITFNKVTDARRAFANSALETLPPNVDFGNLLYADSAFSGCKQLEIDDIVRACNTIQDLQARKTPTTGNLGLPAKCKHNGEEVTDTQSYLNANNPDFLTTLAAKGWTVTFS